MQVGFHRKFQNKILLIARRIGFPQNSERAAFSRDFDAPRGELTAEAPLRRQTNGEHAAAGRLPAGGVTQPEK